ncbi:50S ribosomal protein L10 [Candidatus Peregrinibacteria bacterium]|nr:50S ribosomal protein L10 [Candidatus Peregrinibacteria bacterium]
MALTRVKKEKVLEELVDQLKQAKSVIFADYQGLSVKDIKELRDKLREKDVKFQVVKKTLIRFAAKEAGLSEELSDEILEGPISAAFSMEDEVVAANLLYKFSQKNNNLKLRGAIFEGRILSIEDTKQLAQLPGWEELIGKFVYLIKSPVSGFHGVLNNTLSGFVRVLNAIKEKQEQTS